MKDSTLIAIALGLAIWLLVPGAALAEDDRYGRPAMGASSDPDDHLAESEDMDDMQGHSQDPDDLVVGSGDLDDHVVDSEDPDDLLETSDDLDDHVGHSSDLQDLPSAAALDAAADERAMDEARSQMGPELDLQNASLAEVKHELALAKLRAKEAEHAYGMMRDRNYPRGEARKVIVDERKIAHDRVDQLERRYQEILDQ
jgi:hypothetical protein